MFLSNNNIFQLHYCISHPTCLCYCSDHHDVEDHHHAVTSENLCEEGGRMGPCLWTLEHLAKNDVMVQTIKSTNRCMFTKLTSSHWPRQCRSLGWGSSIPHWGASLQWRWPSGWHAFKKGFYNTYVILVTFRQQACILSTDSELLRGQSLQTDHQNSVIMAQI